MATVNLGSIKFNWQGAYDNATAYAVDDVVSSNGSSYICIAATTGNTPPNATYWEQMSAKGTDGTNGTNGTDVGTVITTQGDLLYRDGSGLQRLGAGTAGQVLQTGGAGANPSWGTLSSDWVKLLDTSVTSTTATVSIDGYFSSSYDIYKVFFEGLRKDTDNQLRLQFNVSGSAETSASYGHMAQYNELFFPTPSSSHGQNSNYAVSYIILGWQHTSSSRTAGGELTFYDPNANSRTGYPNVHYQTHSFDGGNYFYYNNGQGWNQSTTGAISGFSFLASSGSILEMKKLYIYGLKN